MSVIETFLDCAVPELEDLWGPFYDITSAYIVTGKGLRAAPRRLYELAKDAALMGRQRPLEAESHKREMAETLRGRRPFRVWPSFCAHGALNAAFWLCLDAAPATTALQVAHCLQRLVAGPLTTENWGPLEFSETARWPVRMLDIRLLFEHYKDCGAVPARSCPDLTAIELRRGLSLPDRNAAPESPILAAPSLQATVEAGRAIDAQMAVAIPSLPPDPWARGLATEALRMVVLGSHMGSNVEPLSLVQAAASAIQVSLLTSVLGTQYPWPDLICEIFGHCLRSKHVDKAVTTLVVQMYKPTWDMSDLLQTLHSAMEEEPLLQQMDFLLCAQPMTICALLRSLTEKPMLLYQAFPLVGATPMVYAPIVLLQFREMVRSPRRTALVAYSEFLAVQLHRQLGQRPICIRPHSLYATHPPTGAMYDPDRENPRILVSRTAGWARDGASALVSLTEELANRELRPGTRIRIVFMGVARSASDTVAGVSQPFTYLQLKRFRAGIFIPWDMGMLMFCELYNMGMPVLMPSRAWMASIIKRMLEYTDFGWWQARDNTAVALPFGTASGPESPPAWPWWSSNSTVKEILDLYDLTDFPRWPHVTFFTSLPELMVQLHTMDYDQLSEGMMRWNKKALPLSLALLTTTIGGLLGGVEPPPLGSSTCV